MVIREVHLNDIEPLLAVASEDKHAVLRPTHVAEREGKLIGYASVGAIPLVLFYMHSRDAKPINTFRMEKYCEELVRKAGRPMTAVPCMPTSPIYPYMRKMGFTSGGLTELFFKTL